jgi:molybdopterin-guanine dinucleotide biosynthesis protein MobB
MDCSLVILAGGKSLRFGSDKTLLEINGVRIIETISEKLKPFFPEVIIAGSGFGIPGVREVPDIYLDAGPLGGIHAGLTAASNETCFVVACDMPNLYTPLVKSLLARSADYDVVLPKSGEYVQPLFATYKKKLLPQIERLLSQNIGTIIKLYETSKVCYIEVPLNKGNPENDIFYNINYRGDFEMYKKSAPPVLSVVGFSDSGKTTYLEKLIPALKKKGLKLGVIKHDAHSFEVDVPGKDSWRITQAGADITVISSPAKIAILEKWEREEDLSQLAPRLRGKVDLILTEGYKRDKALKIEIRRAEKGREPFCDDAELFAVAGDYAPEKESSVPLLPLDNAEPMAELIIEALEKGTLK